MENILQKADQLQFLGSYDKLIVYFMLTGDHLQTLLYCDSKDLQQNRTYLIVIVSSAIARVSWEKLGVIDSRLKEVCHAIFPYFRMPKYFFTSMENQKQERSLFTGD